MRKLLSLGVAVALMLVGAATAIADPHSAPPAPAGAVATSTPITSLATQDIVCGSGYYCFWTGQNYIGARDYVAGNNPNWYLLPQSKCPTGTWANCAESNYNNGAYDQVDSYTGINYTGNVGYTCRQTGGNLNDEFDRAIEGNQWFSGC